LAPGLDLLEGIFNDNSPVSEDCLYINVFAPATTSPDGGWPVVLFIHGGGFQQGHGRIDLSGFAAYENVVALSFNYRTNSEFPFSNLP
jgi:acetylcholinesterase